MAFWIRLKDSVTPIKVLQFVVIFLMFQLVNCVPVKKPIADDWWCKPCKDLRNLKTRHSRQIRNTLQHQFDSTIFQYELETKKYINLLLPKIGNITKSQMKKIKWLPRKHFYSKIEKGNTKILPELHKYIQVYAASLQRLLDMKFNSHDSWLEESYRKGNFTTVKRFLNLLRCELEDEIFQHRLEGELVTLKKSDMRKKIRIPLSVNNLAEGLIRDHTILEDYYKFLKKCRSKLFSGARNKRKNNNKSEKNKKARRNRHKSGLHKKAELS